MIEDDHIEAGKKVLHDILDAMGFDEYTVYEDQLESRRILSVAVDDHALLIGRKGENLQALQQLMNALLRSDIHDAPFITLDVSNYKKDRIEKIMRIAEDAAHKVQQYGKEFQLKPMSAFERRIVHMVLADKDDLETESVGQDPRRKVIIKPKITAQ
ncbi:KH domain-containing protein [bacterium]|nr:KH domain-containing protein [bacterium]